MRKNSVIQVCIVYDTAHCNERGGAKCYFNDSYVCYSQPVLLRFHSIFIQWKLQKRKKYTVHTHCAYARIETNRYQCMNRSILCYNLSLLLFTVFSSFFIYINELKKKNCYVHTTQEYEGINEYKNIHKNELKSCYTMKMNGKCVFVEYDDGICCCCFKFFFSFC